MDINWLAEQLERPGFSQAGLAKALGKSPSAISRILSGERQLKAAELPIILQYLGEPIAPPSSSDWVVYHAALGLAVSEWNTLEIELSGVLAAAFGPDTEKQTRMLITLFETVRDYPRRLEMLDRVLAIALKNHRNELDWWKGLVVQIRAAGRRRDTYTRSVTAPKDTGEVVGYDPDQPSKNVTLKQLQEDAQHFRKLWQELASLQNAIMALDSSAGLAPD